MQTTSISPEQIVVKPVEEWQDQLFNQFEETVFAKYPRLADCKQHLYEQGAAYASMTGTGSTLFGLFSKQPDISLLKEQCRGEVRIFSL
jgi:4-diphosphocytidyl-2-C-methyl-D-erythritol kinase